MQGVNMIEYFIGLNWADVGIDFGIFVIGLIVGVCIGFNTGRKLAIERITDYVNSKKKS